MKKSLIIILLTVLFDLIGLGIVIPVLNFVVEGFGYSEFYVGLTFATYSFGMFLGGLIFGRLSDNIGRNRALEITISLNIIGYILFALSTNIYMFIFARFLGGLAASGIAVGQAYISDISSDKDRTRNMALVGAMFGIGFMIGPLFGGILSSFGDSLNVIGFVSAIISIINLLVVIFFLPKVKQKKVANYIDKKFKITNPIILVLLTVSFILALGFSAMQSTFGLVLEDRFRFDPKQVGYMFGLIGFTALIYQGFIIKYVKKYLREPLMIILGLSILSIAFILFSFNNFIYTLFFIVFLFPIGYGTVHPTIASMQAKLGANHVGKLLGINASITSIGNIIGPFVAGYFYIIWSGLPYIISSILFIFAIVLLFFKLKKI